MNTRRIIAAAAVIAFALTSPMGASATSLWHDAPGEAGATFHPDHFKSTKTRADVLQELEAARKDGSLWYLQRGLPIPEKSTGPGKTRAEVQREVLSMTAEERRQWQMLGGR
ncbi:MAG: DUF4148 domain-containing protein [Burkholderiaceae bacterium]